MISAVLSALSDRLGNSALSAIVTSVTIFLNLMCMGRLRSVTVPPAISRTLPKTPHYWSLIDLPAKMTAQPETVAKDIYQAQQNGTNVLYTKWIWRWVMLIIRNIPEFQFKKMSI